MTMAFRIPFGEQAEKPVRSPLEFDDTVFPESTAADMLWMLVERHHEIVVETEQNTGGISVEVTRNN